MGVLIDLDERRAAKLERRARVRTPARVELFFDLGDPFSYLAAERVERAFGTVEWTPAAGTGLYRSITADPTGLGELRRRAEERAAALRMPLVWPEGFPTEVTGAMRVAAYAAGQGRAAAFALAAGRLAFCGGFDLDDPDIIAEAAAAAGLGLDECLAAAGEARHDLGMREVGSRLLAAGADRLPALQVGEVLFWGEERIPEAAAAARSAAS
jgi:2-hydroxychromene-2-carboxylate isomerase